MIHVDTLQRTWIVVAQGVMVLAAGLVTQSASAVAAGHASPGRRDEHDDPFGFRSGHVNLKLVHS